MLFRSEKGLVTRNVSAKTHIYTPTLKKEKAQEQFIGKMIQTLFNGSTSQLVLQALGRQKPSESDLAEIKSMIQKLERK